MLKTRLFYSPMIYVKIYNKGYTICHMSPSPADYEGGGDGSMFLQHVHVVRRNVATAFASCGFLQEAFYVAKDGEGKATLTFTHSTGL